MIIAIDFDGTIVEDEYPKIGKEKPFATQTLRMLIEDGHRLVLWTVRHDSDLDAAVQWCHERGVDFYSVNKDYPEETFDGNDYFSRKIKADIFIDDRNIGGLPDWGTIYRIIKERKTREQIIDERMRGSIDEGPKTKKRWWQI